MKKQKLTKLRSAGWHREDEDEMPKAKSGKPETRPPTVRGAKSKRQCEASAGDALRSEPTPVEAPVTQAAIKAAMGFHPGGEEGSKDGEVVKVAVYEVKDVGAPEEEWVRIFVKFGKQAAAMKSYIDLDGRYFGGAKMRCYYWDGVTNFDAAAAAGRGPHWLTA